MNQPDHRTEERRLIRTVLQSQRDLAYLIWLLNINTRASVEAEKQWKALDRKLARMKP
jgi:hypothetical protein